MRAGGGGGGGGGGFLMVILLENLSNIDFYSKGCVGLCFYFVRMLSWN